jgi:dihydroneopterin aldolase
MNKIVIEGINIYAYHGCNEEEEKVGGNYIIDVTIETDFAEAAKTDDLSKTIDYCRVYDIVKREMAIRSKLIEQVGQRIYSALTHELTEIINLEVKLTKVHPPISGDVRQVSVIISE